MRGENEPEGSDNGLFTLCPGPKPADAPKSNQFLTPIFTGEISAGNMATSVISIIAGIGDPNQEGVIRVLVRHSFIELVVNAKPLIISEWIFSDLGRVDIQDVIHYFSSFWRGSGFSGGRWLSGVVARNLVLSHSAHGAL